MTDEVDELGVKRVTLEELGIKELDRKCSFCDKPRMITKFNENGTDFRYCESCLDKLRINYPEYYDEWVRRPFVKFFFYSL